MAGLRGDGIGLSRGQKQRLRTAMIREIEGCVRAKRNWKLSAGPAERDLRPDERDYTEHLLLRIRQECPPDFGDLF